MDLLESTTFTTLVANLLKQNKIPGLSIAIIHNNETASAGYGTANHEDNTPCTGDTLFDIASCSKSLTAASVALLVDDDAYPDVQYDALMSSLLPDDFIMSETSYTDGITVEDVLSHRTGMANHDNSILGPKATHPDTAKSITRNLRNLQPAAPLRSRYLYNNQMYTVATHLVETKTGQNFADFLSDRIFTPLGMTSTTLQPASARAKGWGDRMAKGYIWEGDNTWRGIDPQDCPEGQGAGSVISSANDLVKWVKALLYQENPVNERVYQGLTKMRSIVNPHARGLKAHVTPAVYAAGLEVYYYRGRMVIGHDGNVPGFRSRVGFMPELGFGVVVLGNANGAGGAGTVIAKALMDEVLGVSVGDRPSRNQSKKKERDLAVRSKDKKSGKSTEGPLKISHVESKATDINRKTKQKQKREPQEIPLEMYAGNYWNAGYHTMTVEVKDDQLFINATDRSMGFTMIFEHVQDQTRYIAHLKDDIELTVDPVDTEFILEGGKAVSMGLDLEPAIKEKIWFRLCSST